MAVTVKTHERIERLLKKLDRPTRLLTHHENHGFKEAILTAMRFSIADYVLLLNDDTVPTHDFDLKLLETIRADELTAGVGPVSNHPSDLYQYRAELRSVTIDEEVEPQELMTQFVRAQYRYGVSETPFLTGMCLLLDRRVFESVGYFADDYEHGYFEDLDLSCRIRSQGFRLKVREDCFVYHVGHETYSRKPASDKHRIILENFKAYEEKWSHLAEHEELLRKMAFAGREHPI